VSLKDHIHKLVTPIFEKAAKEYEEKLKNIKERKEK